MAKPTLTQRFIDPWLNPLRDRARMLTFARFVGKRFVDDRLFEAAGALAFTTAFAIVPLSMVVLSVLSAFPVFGSATVSSGSENILPALASQAGAETQKSTTLASALLDYIFANFVPTAADGIKDELLHFVENTASLTVTGVIALVVSLLVTLGGIEATFNRIWRVPTPRPKFSRFLVYWTVLTLGALIAAASLALSARLFMLSIFDTTAGRWLESGMLRTTPLLIELLCFTAIFRVVPHRTVKWRHAFAGALVSVVLFELIKWGLGQYFGRVDSYQKIYGAIAGIPIFLLYIYLTWAAVLVGASFAASLSAFRYQPASLRLPDGYEIYGMLRMLGRFHQARASGKGLHSDELQALDPMLTDSMIQEMLGELCTAGILSRAEGGEWLLARDLDDVSLGELYEAGRLRVPINEAHLPLKDDALGVAALKVVDDLRLPLRDILRKPVSQVYEELQWENRA